ncbi:VOC family protein [Amycolatopsis ultiminotia]|uniref:VOC family protein n=1 Tax=Amycolatopsis ultiminotia TaxID=543629 RepID=A0ABP6UX96_9PSEU
MQTPDPVTIGNVLYPVADLPAAVEFYAGLGLPLSFQDKERFAAFDAGTMFALTAGAENLTLGHAAVSFRVADVDAAMTVATAAGGSVIAPAHDGPHERRAVLEDPWHNLFVVYEKSGGSR